VRWKVNGTSCSKISPVILLLCAPSQSVKKRPVNERRVMTCFGCVFSGRRCSCVCAVLLDSICLQSSASSTQFFAWSCVLFIRISFFHLHLDLFTCLRGSLCSRVHLHISLGVHPPCCLRTVTRTLSLSLSLTYILATHVCTILLVLGLKWPKHRTICCSIRYGMCISRPVVSST
jgi:hypothetical protein